MLSIPYYKKEYDIRADTFTLTWKIWKPNERMSEMKAAIIMGSTSDLPKVEPAVGILKDYGVEVKVRCLSAHRAHEGLSSFINECNEDGTEVIITEIGRASCRERV